MKVSLYILTSSFLFGACNVQKSEDSIRLDKALLFNTLEIMAHDSLEGRFFGTAGNYKAQGFIADQFESLEISPAFSAGYIQKFPYTFRGERRLGMYPIPNPEEDLNNVSDTTVTGGNVAAMIEGKSDKIIVITAHLDHLGKRGEDIYNGADDDASGTAALITMANYFKDRELNHTLIFAAVDAEEIGSLGCAYLLDNFPMSLEKVVLNINMDMIAHNDSMQLYASGLYHHPQLKQPLDEIKSDISLLYGHDNPNNEEQDDWTFASDHREFHKRKIPFIYFGVEDHEDYHKPTDTFENINQEFYVEAVKVVIQAIENYDSFLVNKELQELSNSP